MATAHDFQTTDVRIRLHPDGAYTADMTVDVDALALGVSPSVDSARLAERLRSMSPEERNACIARARSTLQRRVRIRFDGERVIPDVAFPHDGDPATTQQAEPTVLGTLARLRGAIPEDATTFVFAASRSFNAVRLHIVDERRNEAVSYVLEPSERSPPFRLDCPNVPPAWTAVAWRYLKLGFEHILPKELDHILFVLGLFLLSARLGPLLWQVTAFTVAHSVTLALSMLEVVALPARVVEPLIAASIAYVAIENLLTSELKPWRPAVVFAFGLLHGLGFAGVLRELGLPDGGFATALAMFNVGVELGQLAVVGLAMLTIGRLRHKAWYRRAVVMPASGLIAIVGLYWAIERAMFGV